MAVKKVVAKVETAKKVVAKKVVATKIVKKINLPEVELQDKPVVSATKVAKKVATPAIADKVVAKVETATKEKKPSRALRLTELLAAQDKTDAEIGKIFESEFPMTNSPTNAHISFARSKLNSGAWADGKYIGKIKKFTRDGEGKLIEKIKGAVKVKEDKKAKIALVVNKLPKK
jgi:hypothetical protein